MFQLRTLGAVAIISLLTACSSGVQSVPTLPGSVAPASAGGLTPLTTFTARDEESGAIVRIYPTQDVIAAIDQGRQPERRGSTNLQYFGGPVQTAPHLYVVFWGSAWNSSSGDPSGVASRLTAFYKVIGGSKWLNSVSQYTQTGGAHVGNAGNIFIGSYVDTSTTPPAHPSQSQMAAEAVKAAAHFGDRTASASYVVAMPHGVSPSGFGTQYCAYHSTASASGATIAWTNLPYMPDAGASCGANSVNAKGTLDGVTIVGGHEQGETETDPGAGNGWLDSSGAENGDKCAWINLENNPNAGGYPTQPLWSNATSSCVQSF
jgi:serine protease